MEDKPSSNGKMIGGKQVLSHSATLVPFGDNIINSKILCFCTYVCLTMELLQCCSNNSNYCFNLTYYTISCICIHYPTPESSRF